MQDIKMSRIHKVSHWRVTDAELLKTSIRNSRIMQLAVIHHHLAPEHGAAKQDCAAITRMIKRRVSVKSVENQCSRQFRARFAIDLRKLCVSKRQCPETKIRCSIAHTAQHKFDSMNRICDASISYRMSNDSKRKSKCKVSFQQIETKGHHIISTNRVMIAA